MEIKWKSCLKIIGSILLVYAVIHYWTNIEGFIRLGISAALPLIIGGIIAYAVNVLMTFYEEHYFTKTSNKIIKKIKRPVCMLGAFITLIVIVALVIGLVIPEFIACIQLLIEKVPDVLAGVVLKLEDSNIMTEDLASMLASIDIENIGEELIHSVTSGIGNVMGTVVGVVSSVFSGVVTFVLALIFAIYLLAGKETLGRQADVVLKRYMKESHYERVKYVLSVLNDSFHKYIVGQCTEAVILGVLCTIGMLILRLPYATMIGALIALTALIPVAGAYIGAGVGAFMILTVSPLQAVIFLVYIVVLQQVEGNLIYPRVVGSSMGLPAIWVLVAVTIGGGIMGIPGMLLGVPLAATVYRLVKENVKKLGSDKEDVVGDSQSEKATAEIEKSVV